MMNRLGTPLAVLSLATVFGCRSMPGASGVAPWTATYHARTGQVTEADLFERMPRALARHGFLIEDIEERYREYHFKTQWKYRDPFRDERERGAAEARTRIRLRAKRAGRLYALTFEAENMVSTSSGLWVRDPVTEMFEEYAREIASDIRLEISTCIRRY